MSPALSPLLVPIIALVLTFIAVLVALVVAKKDQVIAQKKLIVILLLGPIVLSVPATLVVTGLPYMSPIYLICVGYNLLMGYLYMNYYPKMLVDPDQDRWWIRLLVLMAIVVIGGALFIIIFHYLSYIDYNLLVGSPLLFVFIPFLFNYTLDALLAIPIEIYQVWHYSEEKETNWFDDHFNGMFVFDVELYKTRTDSNFTKIKVKAPEVIFFKDWFQRFLEDFNKKYPKTPIECSGNENLDFGWVFYVRSSFFPVRHYIDFEKTIQENKISDGSVIVAKRVMKYKDANRFQRKVMIDRKQSEKIVMKPVVDRRPEEQETQQASAKEPKPVSQEASNGQQSVVEGLTKQLVDQGASNVQREIQQQLTNQLAKTLK